MHSLGRVVHDDRTASSLTSDPHIQHTATHCHTQPHMPWRFPRTRSNAPPPPTPPLHHLASPAGLAPVHLGPVRTGPGPMTQVTLTPDRNQEPHLLARCSESRLLALPAPQAAPSVTTLTLGQLEVAVESRGPLAAPALFTPRCWATTRDMHGNYVGVGAH